MGSRAHELAFLEGAGPHPNPQKALNQKAFPPHPPKPLDFLFKSNPPLSLIVCPEAPPQPAATEGLSMADGNCHRTVPFFPPCLYGACLGLIGQGGTATLAPGLSRTPHCPWEGSDIAGVFSGRVWLQGEVTHWRREGGTRDRGRASLDPSPPSRCQPLSSCVHSKPLPHSELLFTHRLRGDKPH